LSTPHNAISIQNVTKLFWGIEAVSRCSFNINGGTITGIIGPNGAGKSTLFNIIGGQYTPDFGDILIGEKYVTGFSPHQLAQRGLFRAFQVAHEYPRMTVIDNLKIAPINQKGESLLRNLFSSKEVKIEDEIFEEKAIEVLKILELEHLKDEQAGFLSGGQKKLLEFGRILMSEPKIVLLDEISAGINRTLMKKLVTLIKKINKEKNITFCVIEHDMDLIKELCNTVIVMTQGSVLAKGTFEEIIGNSEVQEAYLGLEGQ